MRTGQELWTQPPPVQLQEEPGRSSCLHFPPKAGAQNRTETRASEGQTKSGPQTRHPA